MAKKKRIENSEVEFALDVEEKAEAVSPEEQPAEQTENTVCKPVGQGGPVPIIAPKHNTIQLQPIIVPLAVVPYMSQDSSVLRTEQKARPAEEEQEGEATSFKAVASRKKTSTKGVARVFSLISLILSLVLVSPFIVSGFKGTLGSVILEEFNIIGAVRLWASEGFGVTPYTKLVYLAAAFFTALAALVTLVTLIAGRYPRAFSVISSFIVFGCMLGVLITDLVRHAFVVKERTAFVVMLALSALWLLLSIVFSAVLNRREDRLEEARYSSEI